jgi:two-component system sensor histidine kinase YesM
MTRSAFQAGATQATLHRQTRQGDFSRSGFVAGIRICVIDHPLIENAIVHGIEKKEGSGFIRIRGFVEGNNVVIVISDNGIGFDINCLNFEKESGKEHHHRFHHIGIINTDKRIKNMYGNTYGINNRNI